MTFFFFFFLLTKTSAHCSSCIDINPGTPVVPSTVNSSGNLVAGGYNTIIISATGFKLGTVERSVFCALRVAQRMVVHLALSLPVCAPSKVYVVAFIRCDRVRCVRAV
jgi:hypothetical protein